MANKRPETALMDLYYVLYKERHRVAPKMNRYADKWGFKDMVDSVGYARAELIVRYYFELTPTKGHSVQGLLYNIIELGDELDRRDADRLNRKKLLEETRERVEQFRSQSNKRNLQEQRPGGDS